MPFLRLDHWYTLETIEIWFDARGSDIFTAFDAPAYTRSPDTRYWLRERHRVVLRQVVENPGDVSLLFRERAGEAWLREHLEAMDAERRLR